MRTGKRLFFVNFGLGGFFLGFGGGFADFVAEILFELFGFFGARFEAVDATFGVDNLFFTGEERVRSRADLDFDKRVFVTVGPFDSFGGLGGRLGEEREIGLFVGENDGTVVFGVN